MSGKGIDYEVFMMEEVIKSRRNAWIMASVSWLLTFVLGLTLFFLFPLKTVVPYVIKENVVTGETRIVTMLDKKILTTDEATDKHFLSEYVRKREQYYYDVLADDYYNVLLFSSETVQKEYQSIYSGEQSRDKLLSNKFKVEVKILSVVLGTSSGTKIATVRSKITTLDLHTSTKGIDTLLTSTIAYEYQPDKKMKVKDRMLNPLGFTVLTYRKDKEVAQ